MITQVIVWVYRRMKDPFGDSAVPEPSRQTVPLITVWLQVRVLPGPPRRPPKAWLERPALRLADEEVAECLNPRHRAHFFGVDEVTVERRHLDIAQNLGEPTGTVDRVGGQDADADARFDRDLERRDVVDHIVIRSGIPRLAPGRREPVHGREIGRLIAAEGH